MSQKVLINKHIGATRFIYNLALETRKLAWDTYKKRLTGFELARQLPDLKKECQWLNEINSQTLEYSLLHLDQSFEAFFKNKGHFPKFKKRKTSGSFPLRQRIKINKGILLIPKFREGIRIVVHRQFEGKIKIGTISKTATNKYFISIICEVELEKKNKPMIDPGTTIGVDLGLKDFLTTSNNDVISNPRFLRKSESKLKYIQRKYSKYKGNRTKKRLANMHEKVAAQRKDFLHKVSAKLISDNQTICIETLRVKNLIQNHVLAKSISDVAWGYFKGMLEYKSEWYGKNLLKIGTFEPSSKTCACCGNVNKELTLKDREWTCEECGSVLDRDLNAAINIKNFALKNLSVGCRLENQDELPSIEGVMTPEVY